MLNKVNYLRLGGILSFLVALFQAIISFSPSWSLYFGAPEELISNSLLLIFSGIVVSIIFLIFGLYGLSGAGDIRHLPLERNVLLGIASIYTLRGSLIILQLLILLSFVQSKEVITLPLILSSIVSLIIGIIYFIGIKNNWHNLK